jgi:hypothetical protein
MDSHRRQKWAPARYDGASCDAMSGAAHDAGSSATRLGFHNTYQGPQGPASLVAASERRYRSAGDGARRWRVSSWGMMMRGHTILLQKTKNTPNNTGGVPQLSTPERTRRSTRLARSTSAICIYHRHRVYYRVVSRLRLMGRALDGMLRRHAELPWKSKHAGSSVWGSLSDVTHPPCFVDAREGRRGG